MAFLPILSKSESGFLLMEALVAILLITSFTLIIGMSFHHINNQYSLAQKRLQALTIAHNYIDKIIHKAMHFDNFPCSNGAYRIHAMQSPLNENALLITVTVTWLDSTVRLQSVVAEDA